MAGHSGGSCHAKYQPCRARPRIYAERRCDLLVFFVARFRFLPSIGINISVWPVDAFARFEAVKARRQCHCDS
jgi:hypothetical protein